MKNRVYSSLINKIDLVIKPLQLLFVLNISFVENIAI